MVHGVLATDLSEASANDLLSLAFLYEHVFSPSRLGHLVDWSSSSVRQLCFLLEGIFEVALRKLVCISFAQL